MFCKHCGHPVNPEESVCQGCGQPVSVYYGRPGSRTPPQAGSNQDRPGHGNQQAKESFQQPSQKQAPYGNIPHGYAHPGNGTAFTGNASQGNQQANKQTENPYSQMPQRPAYPGGPQPSEKKITNTNKIKPLIIFLCIAVFIGIASGIFSYTRSDAVNSAVTEMQAAVMEAEALSEEVEALYTSEDGNFIKTDLKLAEVITLQNRLARIQVEPDDTYAVEVKKKVNLSDHEKLIEQMGERLNEAEEKRVARAEVNAIFEVDAVCEEAYNSDIDLPLDIRTEAEDVDELLEKYGYDYYFLNDFFWIQVLYVLDDAETQMMCVDDARAALDELEEMETISEDDFQWAQEEINTLYEGTVKSMLQTRLDVLVDLKHAKESIAAAQEDNVDD